MKPDFQSFTIGYHLLRMMRRDKQPKILAEFKLLSLIRKTIFSEVILILKWLLVFSKMISAYLLQGIRKGLILVLGLSSGTIDVSYMEISNGVFEVTAVSCESFGGEDSDHAWLNFICCSLSWIQ
ncbi:hypothetical protein ABKV19_013642 [Rosa sericea]